MPKVSNEEREKYIREEEATQRNHGKKQKIQFKAISRIFSHSKFATSSFIDTSRSSHVGGEVEVEQ
jgi:hypothetical protein